MNEDRLAVLERKIREVEERNLRVEADKAWERSTLRIGSISLLTYAVAIAILASFGAAKPFFSAVIPVCGYLLSVQSIPHLKKWWLRVIFKAKR